MHALILCALMANGVGDVTEGLGDRTRADAPPPAWGGTVVGAVLGVAGGAAAGVGLALVAGAAANATSPCRQPGVICTDDMNGSMAMLLMGAFSVPVGALLGGVAGGFTGNALLARPAPAPRERLY